MDAPKPSPAIPASTADDDFDRYWRKVVNDERTGALLVSADKDEIPSGYRVNSPIGYGNLITILGSGNVVRLPVRELYGRPAHAYVVGIVSGLPETDAALLQLDENPNAADILYRHGVDASIRGKMVIVIGDGIDPRDLQKELIAADADTIPEIECSFALSLDAHSRREWRGLETAMNGKMIPSVMTHAPSMDRIAWLIRAVIVGLDTDVGSHAMVEELGAKKPMFKQAVAALWAIQEAHFNGSLVELSDDDDAPGLPKLEKPSGFSDRYQAVIH